MAFFLGTSMLFSDKAFMDFGPLALTAGRGGSRLPNHRWPAQRRLAPTGPFAVVPAAPASMPWWIMEGELIYVGKAKRLRVRLLSYFRSRGRPRKAGRILALSESVCLGTLPERIRSPCYGSWSLLGAGGRGLQCPGSTAAEAIKGLWSVWAATTAVCVF